LEKIHKAKIKTFTAEFLPLPFLWLEILDRDSERIPRSLLQGIFNFVKLLNKATHVPIL
jgi:hypothetical protein